MIGRALVACLGQEGHAVVRLVRRNTGAENNEILWNPVAGQLNSDKVEGFDVVVHLAGENIARNRWTAAYKTRVEESRLRGTRLLSEVLAHVRAKPRVLLSASAVGYYGNRGEDWLDEDALPGEGFLPRLCVAWEQATQAAAQAGIRVVLLRIAPVLTTQGGMLAQMLPVFRLGLGGPLGNGRHYVSWIVLDDLVSALLHAMANSVLRGPVNLAAPNPVTSAVFAKTLGRVLHRPACLPVPAFALRLALGELADVVLSSQRVRPKVLLDSGFAFSYPQLEDALRHVLGRSTTQNAA